MDNEKLLKSFSNKGSVYTQKSEWVCTNCGITFNGKRFRFSERKFCNNKCFNNYQKKQRDLKLIQKIEKNKNNKTVIMITDDDYEEPVKLVKVLKICELCERDITNKKQDHHHVDYEKDVTLLLCYSCHQLMHGRPIYKNMNFWVKTFGKDKGFYELSKKFILVYESKMKEVK